MRTYTAIRSPSAIGVGVFFTLVTAYVLLEDVARHGAALNTKHVMTLAVLGGTVYFGHKLWSELTAFRLGTTLGCALLFIAGTLTCVVMSAGRNAEVTTTKSLQANSVNTGRDRVQRDRDEAKARYTAALTAEEAECGSGQGTKCQAKRITTMLRREDYDAAEVKLRAQAPLVIANGDVRAAADLFSRLPFVKADAGTIEALLLLAFPFLQSLFCEIAAVCGFAIGLGHVRRVSPTVAAVQLPLLPHPREFPEPETVSDDVPDGWAPPTVNEARSMAKKAKAEQIFEALRKSGRPVCNDELAALLSCSKGEASRQVTALKNIGLLRREPRGRYVAISLRPFATV